MNKVIVIGPGGAGKSYFSTQLAKYTNLPLYHLDNVFWHEDRTHIERSEFDEELSDILKKDRWIIDGDYSRTYEIRMEYCDTIYFLDFSLEDSLKGVESRIGKKRDDIPFIDYEFDPEFKEWIKRWFIEKRPKLIELLGKYKDKTIIVLKNKEEVNNYLDNFVVE